MPSPPSLGVSFRLVGGEEETRKRLFTVPGKVNAFPETGAFCYKQVNGNNDYSDLHDTTTPVYCSPFPLRTFQNRKIQKKTGLIAFFILNGV